ncbi:MAG TPA: KUP/HAK/KT family potassium transporter [Bacteroidales bacterium]|nr:KUP/HAK/KT family potassium transporter [Bacteroidales bacterium]
MNGSEKHLDIKKLSLAGLIITLGVVYGDLGTSPLYTMNAIIHGGVKPDDSLLVFGGLSCIFWTLTLQTTIKYILITLRADNNGEGGIFALFALMRKKSSWAAILTMIGAAALLADGVITPSITVTSAVEGLNLVYDNIPVVPIVLVIFGVLFFIQQFGTNFVGGSFGPIMVVWFSMLAILGVTQLVLFPGILKAVNPVYAYEFLTGYPKGFILLGAVFLCTTGAEALYSDLGHCGRSNIRISWIFVKVTLLLNYFGQGAWILLHHPAGSDINVFFIIMPKWFLIPGVLIATAAAVIASQALISGSYTLISEAVSLNFWPKIRVLHPTLIKGQVYIPFVNWFLWVACSLVVLCFRKSTNMEAAYGLAITITMIMTTLLLSYYMYQKGLNHRLVMIMLLVYLTIEGSFLIANLHKFVYGGWFTLLLAFLYFLVMFGWYFGRKIKNRYITFSNLDEYTDLIRDLAMDESVPKTATNLVYIIHANRQDQVESKVIYSILKKQPKRANTYWLLHVNMVTEPFTFDYTVNQIIPGVLIRIDFNIGFRVEPRIDLYFSEVLDDLMKSGEIQLESSYDSLKKHHLPGDFKFILIDRVMPRDNPLSSMDNLILEIHNLSRKLTISDVKALQLDSTITIEESVPISVEKPSDVRIRRKD